MPHRTEVCEIIPARVARVAALAAPSLRPLSPRAADPSTYPSSLLRSDSRRYLALHNKTLGNTSRDPSVSIWRLFLSTIQGPTSRFACSLRPETASKGLYGSLQPPQSALLRCHCDDEPCPKGGTTPPRPMALQRRSQGNAFPYRPYIGVPYLGTTFGDSEDKGLQRCRPRPTPGPTCGLPNSQLPCALPPELCVGGARQERDRTLSGRGESFGTAAKTSTPGRKQPTNQTALENADTASLPCRGERRVGSKLRRGDATPRSASHTVHPTSREVPVTPTLARWCPQWTPALGSGQITSDLISTPMGPR